MEVKFGWRKVRVKFWYTLWIEGYYYRGYVSILKTHFDLFEGMDSTILYYVAV